MNVDPQPIGMASNSSGTTTTTTTKASKRSRSKASSSSVASVSSSSSSSSSYSSSKPVAFSLAYSYVPPSPVNVPTVTTTKAGRRTVNRGQPIQESTADHAAAAVMALGFGGQTMSELSQEVVGDA